MQQRLDTSEALARLPETFVAFRRARGMSLRDVAAVTGISNVTLSEFERRKHDLPLAKVVALVRWLEHPD